MGNDEPFLLQIHRFRNFSLEKNKLVFSIMGRWMGRLNRGAGRMRKTAILARVEEGNSVVVCTP